MFLCLNFLCVFELMVRNEDADCIDPEEYFGSERLKTIISGSISNFRKINTQILSGLNIGEAKDNKEVAIPIEAKKKLTKESDPSEDQILFEKQVAETLKFQKESKAAAHSSNFKSICFVNNFLIKM